MNLATIIDRHPDDAAALISRGRTTTYSELRVQVAGLRGGLAGLGISDGDRVALVCANNWYFAVTYLAVLGAGAVAVPLNPLSPPPVIERELATVGAKAVVMGPAGRKAFGGVDRAALPALETVIAPDPDSVDGAVGLDELIAAKPVTPVDVAADHLAALLFTSGTAGAPRAAVLTHGNLLANLEQVQRHPGRAQGPEDVSLGVLPLFHIFGLNVVLGLSLYAGSSVVLVERFDPATALETITRYGVTVVGGAPPMWQSWADLPDADPTAFRTVRLAVSGAAKLPDEVADRFEARFGVHVSEGYGLTEASPVVTSSSGASARRGSVGVPVPDLEVRLVDDDGEDALAGDPGEIWVRGPNVFSGYWEDPDATAQVLTPDGWLKTGDVAAVDDDGYLYLVDRAKDLIIVSGFNVFPAEVEEVLVEHPAVEQAAVVGVAHPHTGEAVRAYVVVADGASVEEDDVIEFARSRLPKYKSPSKVLFVDELPVGPSGKVLRRELR